MTNPICQACAGAINTINGRYCNILRRKVEYSTQPPCKELPKPTTI